MRDRRAKSGLCRSCASTGEGNSFYGKKHSPATRAKMVESNKHRDPATYYPVNNHRLPSEEISCIQRERWSHLTEDERREKTASLILLGQKHNKKSKNTKIERIVGSILDELGVEYETNYKIGLKFVDILIENGNKIIECFGDYWHCNPKIYSPTYFHKSLKMEAAFKWGKDLTRLRELASLEYDILILWEDDIKHKREETLSKIQDFLR